MFLIKKLRPTKTYDRSQLIDVMRGSGILMMVVFHFCYDLTLFGIAEIPIYTDRLWIAFRFIILATFLTTVGASLYLHHQRGINYKTYWRRVLIIAANAYLITLATYITLDEKYVFFGILHLIALSSVLGLLFLRFYWLNLFLGIFIIYLGYNYSNEVFNSPGVRWIGMLTVATGSADFTPIFPFFGLVLLGIFAARFLGPALYLSNSSGFFLTKWLANLGRFSLIIYMVHQPIFWIILYIGVSLAGAGAYLDYNSFYLGDYFIHMS